MDDVHWVVASTTCKDEAIETSLMPGAWTMWRCAHSLCLAHPWLLHSDATEVQWRKRTASKAGLLTTA